MVRDRCCSESWALFSHGPRGTTWDEQSAPSLADSRRPRRAERATGWLLRLADTALGTPHLLIPMDVGFLLLKALNSLGGSICGWQRSTLEDQVRLIAMNAGAIERPAFHTHEFVKCEVAANGSMFTFEVDWRNQSNAFFNSKEMNSEDLSALH